MKVLITGADGFLGRNTVRYLREKGHDVTPFTQDVRRILPYERFDCLYHFAAFVGGRKGIDNNHWLITENIELDRVTFKWAEEFCSKIVYPSSCAAYPLRLQQSSNTPMHEDDFGEKTFDLYGLSKLVAESMLATLSIPVMVMRPFSIYGPGQSMDYPLPCIIERAKRGICSVWGSGTQTRDWVYIDDATKIFEQLAHREESVTVNIGTGIPITFKEVAETIYKQIHGTIVPVQTQTAEPEGAGHRYADITRMSSLGLSCPTSFADGIRNMI